MHDVKKFADFVRKNIERLSKTQKNICLALAAEAGSEDCTSLLLKNGADVNAKVEWDRTPLHCAALYGHRGVAELLLSNGANVNARNSCYDTPLHHAVAWGHKNVTELLLEHGADVNASDRGYKPGEFNGAPPVNTKEAVKMVKALRSSMVSHLNMPHYFVALYRLDNSHDQRNDIQIALRIYEESITKQTTYT